MTGKRKRSQRPKRNNYRSYLRPVEVDETEVREAAAKAGIDVDAPPFPGAVLRSQTFRFEQEV